ncbi:hypothetical protein MFLAVUS_010194 [Mucor flavus]|uniref:Uncharacterized protein n=1 Tax=Mucor flavus TaxID=439312 RepID=A0ABP9ZC06_9FUNG
MTCSTKLFLMAITVLTVWLQFSQAYCVYNNLDGDDSILYVKEREANPSFSFKKQVNNGEKECCPWDNLQCNTTGQRNGAVAFYITFGFFGASTEGSETLYAICTGGGGLVLRGNNTANVDATCNNADGSVEHKIIGPAYSKK